MLVRTLPEGSHKRRSGRRPYLVNVSHYSAGRAFKVEAKELGGADYISCNFYDLSGGPRMFPCEMSAEKVIGFLRALE